MATDEPVLDRDEPTTAGPWKRILGILVLGSFAAATKTARRTTSPHHDGRGMDGHGATVSTGDPTTSVGEAA